MEEVFNMNERIKDTVIAFMMIVLIMLFAYHVSQTHIELSKTQTTVNYATHGNDTIVFPKEWGEW